MVVLAALTAALLAAAFLYRHRDGLLAGRGAARPQRADAKDGTDEWSMMVNFVG